jgi:hypothetical protein
MTVEHKNALKMKSAVLMTVPFDPVDTGPCSRKVIYNQGLALLSFG